jgi:hypothetical protein
MSLVNCAPSPANAWSILNETYLSTPSLSHLALRSRAWSRETAAIIFVKMSKDWQSECL